MRSLHNVIALGLVALAQVRVAQAAIECAWKASSSIAGTWSSTAINNAGTLAIAAIKGGAIYSSTDGITYAATGSPGPKEWTAVGSSGTGTVMIGATALGTGEIWYSTNNGVSWTLSDATNQDYTALTVNGNGGHATAGSRAGTFYSHDQGATWTASDLSSGGKYFAVAYNYAGTFVLAAESGGPIMKSTDGGATYTSLHATTRNWQAIAQSSSYIVACVQSSTPYFSTNSGASFTQSTGTPTTGTSWGAVTIDSTGQYVKVFEQTAGAVWESADSGATFTLQYTQALETWSGAAASGHYLNPGLQVASSSAAGGVMYYLDCVEQEYVCGWLKSGSAPSGAWSAVAVSGDGAVAVAARKGIAIYRSNGADVGKDWGALATGLEWTAMAISNDGLYILAATDDGTNGAIWLSSTGLTTGTFILSTTYATQRYTSLAMNGDGAKAVAGSTVGLHYSTDSGVTWAPSLGTWTVGPYYSIAYDSARSTLGGVFAAHRGGYIYKSTDDGATFNALFSNAENWMAVASSGVYLVAAVDAGELYYSINSGSTFAKSNSPTRAWTGITMDSTGQFVSAVEALGAVYQSDDYGVTYTLSLDETGGGEVWTSIAASASPDHVQVAASKGPGGSDGAV
ncbi:hypothetical protein B484DRAFT_434804, partial [Ochromonadaceae sp. CCMP2298]